MSEWNTNIADLGKDLRESIADLQDVNSAVGLLRCLGLGIAVLGSIWLAYGLPLMGVDGGYFEESLRMGQRPLLIGEDREIEAPWRNDIVVAC